MDIVLEVEKSNVNKLRDALNKDNTTTRASIVFKDGSIIGKENQFCKISGTDEIIEKAKEISKDLGKEVDEKTKDEFLLKLKEEEEKASEGMGGIFG